MKRKYLDEIGLTDRWDTWNDSRGEYAAIREEYGVDPRETFSLDNTFYEWLYEHLKMFMEEADPVVDMDSPITPRWEWDGRNLSQREAIFLMIDLLNEYFLFQTDSEEYCRQHFHECTELTDVASEENMTKAYGACEDQAEQKALQAAELFVKVLPAMWW